MINFDYIEQNKEELRLKYRLADPFPHLHIIDFCDEDKLNNMLLEMPVLENKSRDAFFAKNKFEKSKYYELGPLFAEFNKDLNSNRFASFLSFITDKKVFVDPANHGGGLHQGRGKSKLDMHLDYNYHPINKSWWRELNILFYFSPKWKSEYGGHLNLEDLRSGKKKKLPIYFNSLIIQECSSYSLHGYDLTDFPSGSSRLSIATYAFVEHKSIIESPRTTDWFPDRQGGSATKQFVGRNIHKLIRIKSKFFGSGTSKN